MPLQTCTRPSTNKVAEVSGESRAQSPASAERRTSSADPSAAGAVAGGALLGARPGLRFRRGGLRRLARGAGRDPGQQARQLVLAHGAVDRAGADAVRAGQLAARGAAPAGEPGDAAIAGLGVVAGMPVDGVDVQAVDDAVALGRHAEAFADRDGVAGAQAEGGGQAGTATAPFPRVGRDASRGAPGPPARCSRCDSLNWSGQAGEARAARRMRLLSQLQTKDLWMAEHRPTSFTMSRILVLEPWGRTRPWCPRHAPIGSLFTT